MLAALVLSSLMAANVVAGPQPGDVVDPPAVVDGTKPVPVDAGPATTADGGPAPVSLTTSPAPDDAQAVPVAGVDPAADPAGAAPSTQAATATTDPTKPVVEGASPRTDPDGVRADEAPPADVEPAPADAPPPEGFGFGGVPAINFDSDNGFGFGVVATLFAYDGKTRPYRAALTLQLFMTSKLVQDHNIVLDWLDVADLPLRLYTRVGYLQSLTQNYCGLGGDVTCDPDTARAAASDAGLVDDRNDADDAFDAFARHFYQRRFINPYGVLLTRWALATEPIRFEIMAGYRGFYFIPGTWDDENKDGEPDLFPYPGSLYAQDHPDGEAGFDSVVQLGFMVDTRDNEPAPTEGVWFEASARTASPLIGSTWTWSGANLTLRGYTPITNDRKLVLANRFVFDAVIGEPPVQELARAGGSFDYYLYGGSEAGRGIRAQRFLGKLRTFNQTELRWRFLDVDFLGQQFGFTTAAFVDLGIVGTDLREPGGLPLIPGFGGALRLAWNENFIVRFDVGFSPIEQYAPSLYILIGNPF